ncbi:MAG: beta-galactosidase [Lachnospiraceae bacterium]|jgi:beta-galactosidase|nr:beta-galactosidase [Lachnospiraceae bacterium]
MKAEIDWLDDPEVFRVNRLPAHSDHRFYRDMEELKEGKSALEQSLNGIWKFRYSPNAASRPAEFYKEGFEYTDFDEIAVPCHIEMAGYDKIHYINTMYPWEGHIYRRPAYSLGNGTGWKGMFSQAVYNPVGSYVKEFDLEKGLLGSRVIICLEGVEQALYLWLNGSFVGYAEDSFTPSEFDLTPYLKEKGNKLAIEVHKRSSAAFLEDQDFFRFFGIFRNVTLYAKPKMHVEDFWAQPELKEDGTGSLAVEARVSMEQGRSGRMEITLEDGEGNSLLRHEMLLSPDGADIEKTGIYKEVYGKMQKQALGKVVPWENKTPVLYFLLIRLYDEEGGLVEAVPYSIGFRKIEIRDKVIRLNGKRLIINGVNRHEWSAERGRCIGMEEMRQDMDCFLANHINAVRTCHYPNQIPWYDMCDKNGVYMMAEANLESHGSWQKMGVCEPSWNVPGSLPQWREAVLDRMISNFELFKNHVSVLFWSLGNESYAGDNIEAMNRYLKEKEDGRLVHYEGVFHNRAYEDSVSDVESRMYASPEQIREYLEKQPKKPFLLCEYMHDMGNSLGGMDSYMKLLDAYEMYHGGFIWDYIDQAIFVEDEVTGRKVLRYGGDFDDRPSDYSFSGNGIVFADRTEKPAMQEVRYYYGQYK